MFTSFSLSRHLSRLAVCAAMLLVVSACMDRPKYKHSNGRFPEWEGYESKHFYPSNGIVTAVDTTANTVTVGLGDKAKVLTVTHTTRILHEGTDIPLAQLPLNQNVKYVMSEDGKDLLSIWFGTRLYQFHPATGARQ